MTGDSVMVATWKDFAKVLGYEILDDAHDADINGWRCHDSGVFSGKEVVKDVTIASGICGQTDDLIRPYEIMHQIYRETIAPHVGNLDQVHGFVFDFLKLTKEKEGTGQKLEVMDFI